MTCNTPDGNEYTNVPEGLYLYVTDVIVKRRLTSQTTVAASVRIWEESGTSDTGCDGLIVELSGYQWTSLGPDQSNPGTKSKDFSAGIRGLGDFFGQSPNPPIPALLVPARPG